MAHEITFGYALNKTLWAAVFKNDGGTYKVNVTGSDAWEAWNDVNVATYDISLTERGGGGMYTATWPTAGVIAAGVYFIVIYEGAVAATDSPRGQNEFYWDGTAEMNITTVDTLIDTVKVDTAAILVDTDTMEADLKTYMDDEIIGADSDTLETLSDQLDGLTSSTYKKTNVYGPGE